MSYRIIKSTDKHYQVLHPDGTKFTVPKTGISKQMKDKIEGLPKFFGGGTPGGFSEGNASDYGAEDNSFQDKSFEKKGLQYGDEIPSNEPQKTMFDLLPNDQVNPEVSETPNASVNSAIPLAGQQLASNDMTGIDTTGKPSDGVIPSQSGINSLDQSGLGELMSSYDKLGAAGERGVREAKSAENALNERLSINQVKMENLAEQANQHAVNASNEMQNIANTKVDQGHFWGSMSTGNKILAGIGAALSGIGSGLTGKSNLALDSINKSIQQDIDLQKDQKNSLYNAALQKFKNTELADTSARMAALNQADIALKKYAAGSRSADAMMNAEKLSAQIGIQKAQLSLVAKQQLQKQFVNQKLYNEGVPTEQIPATYRADPKFSQQVVDVDGRTYVHKGSGDAPQQARDYESAVVPIISQIKKLSTLNPANPADRSEADSIRAGLATSIAGLKSLKIGSKRVNEVEADRALEQISNPNSFYQAFVGKNIRNNSFINALTEETEALRSQNYWGYKPLGFKVK